MSVKTELLIKCSVSVVIGSLDKTPTTCMLIYGCVSLVVIIFFKLYSISVCLFTRE